MPLPRAMLLDLDDTIISAYNNPGPLWLEVLREMSSHLGGLPVEAVGEAILASGETFWDDPERHRNWRQQMFPARREVVRLAFEASPKTEAQPSLNRSRSKSRTAIHASAKRATRCFPGPPKPWMRSGRPAFSSLW